MSIETNIGIKNGKLVITAKENGVESTQTIDLKPRTGKTAKTIASLIADIQNLSAADKAKLDLAIQADFLIHNPGFASALGIPLVIES